MAKKIAWTDQARADVRAIDRETAIDLLHRLARFLETEEGDVKRLTEIRRNCGCASAIIACAFMTTGRSSRSFASAIGKRPTDSPRRLLRTAGTQTRLSYGCCFLSSHSPTSIAP